MRLLRWLFGDRSNMTKCPGCRRWLPDNDWHGQRLHMETNHPNIIAERLAESARWDGWEQD
jgi:hypothetical protein